ncbi:hypothetical protein GF312_12795, partial [Candidatus Poribacteria bacterium]|nr:hypothetical protein [Candidatus Poribacteria bacterium]
MQKNTIMKEKLKAYIQLIRIPLFPIPIVTTLSGVALASEGNVTWRGYLVLVVSMLGYFAGMMKNDYFHSETDAVVNPDKPIPSGRIPRKEVLVLASTTYIVCIILGMIINIKTGLLVMLLIVISHLYNAMFKA